jgi:hypothetical protein
MNFWRQSPVHSVTIKQQKQDPTRILDDQSENDKPPAFDPSKLTPEALEKFRQSLLSQIQAKITHFYTMARRWNLAYYILGIVAITCNLIVVGLSSAQSTFDGSITGLAIGNTVVSILGVVCLGLNAQLQTRSNAIYAREAWSKYSPLERTIWDDLAWTVARFEYLNSKYDETGVGLLLMASTAGSMKSASIKRYAYPRPYNV